MDTSKPCSLAMALKDYFGFHPGQSIASFMAELKALNDADRAEFRTLLTGVGYKITA